MGADDFFELNYVAMVEFAKRTKLRNCACLIVRVVLLLEFLDSYLLAGKAMLCVCYYTETTVTDNV
jgi:hypothetical protein